MRHPAEGVLRRLLDEPIAVADPNREHIAGCGRCLGLLAAIRDDAAFAGAALASDDVPDVDTGAGWRRLSAAASANGAATAAVPPDASRSPGFLRRPVVAAAAFALVLTGAGTAAANNWLQIFRTEQIAPLSLSTADLVALPDLSAYGDLDVTEDLDVIQVPSGAAAAAETGMDVPEVAALPRGVTGEPVYRVGTRVSATFTFSAQRAAQAAADAGTTLPAPPPGLDKTQVRLDAGPGVVQTWSSSSGAPALIVARAVAPTAFSSGVPFETVRDYLLSLPGLPEDVAAQLRTFPADGSTLPLPVPADQVSTSSAQVKGHSATVFATRDRTMTAVVWADDGVVTAVAGSLDADEVLSIAGDLR